MSIVEHPIRAKLEPAQRFVLSGIGWERYEKILEAVDGLNIRMTYDQGKLELMSPLPPHEILKGFLRRLLDEIAYRFKIQFRALGSTTARRQDLDRGLEPDECFYFQSASKVRNWERLDLSREPPPDLAIEIDITTSSLDRMSVYASLGIPEIWRFDGESLQAYALEEGNGYRIIESSNVLSFVPLEEIVPLLQQSVGATNDVELIALIRDWVTETVAPLKQQRDASRPPPPANP